MSEGRLLHACVLLTSHCLELQFLDGSHKLGRLEHTTAGEQAGANPKQVELALARSHRFPTITGEMKAGGEC